MEMPQKNDRLYNAIHNRFGIVPDVLDFNLGPTTFAVYAALCIYANKEGMAFPAVRTLAEKLSIGFDTVLRAIKKMESEGLIKVTRPEKQGRGHFNRYLIVDKLLTPLEKRGAPQEHFIDKGGKNVSVVRKKGGTTGTEQYHRTIEQYGEKNFDESPVDNSSSNEDLKLNIEALEKTRITLEEKGIL